MNTVQRLQTKQEGWDSDLATLTERAKRLDQAANITMDVYGHKGLWKSINQEVSGKIG